jgi:hypothetical protein
VDQVNPGSHRQPQIRRLMVAQKGKFLPAADKKKPGRWLLALGTRGDLGIVVAPVRVKVVV